MRETCASCHATWDTPEPHLVFVAHLDARPECRQYWREVRELIAEDYAGA
ncbi:MAG TPA: hypothetical protein VM889_14795 [Candidatus Thermoplasmatota archaeon]|nr:hypothetical protein [Candidatus Thermoplasmatota archaeon]